MQSKQKFKAAIIGCGNIGYGLEHFKPGFTTTHIKAYMDNDDTELVAVQDIDINKASQAAKDFQVPNVYASIKEMMEKARPEIISICTPDDTHHAILKTIVEYDCVSGIWCEKPMAVSIAQGKEMVKLCESRNVKLLVNHVRRYDKFYIAVRNQLNQLIGDVQSVVCYYSGGIVTTGSHLLDLLHHILGDCRSVLAKVSRTCSGYECELTYHNGVKAYLIPVDSFSAMELNIIGKKGRLDTVNIPFGRYQYRFYPVKRDSKLDAKYMAEASRIGLDGIERNFFQRALRDLVSSIRMNREPISSGKIGLISLELISAISYSAEKNTQINLPFEKLDYVIPKPGGDVKKWKKQQ